MLVGANGTAVDVDVLRIPGLEQHGKGLFPDAPLAPSVEPGVDPVPGTVLLWQISPGRPASQDPDHAALHGLVVLAGCPRFPDFSGGRRSWIAFHAVSVRS